MYPQGCGGSSPLIRTKDSKRAEIVDAAHRGRFFLGSGPLRPRFYLPPSFAPAPFLSYAGISRKAPPIVTVLKCFRSKFYLV